MADIKVLGVGAPILDILVNIEDSFLENISGKKGGMELVSHEELDSILAKAETAPVKATGGSAANSIFGLARLGISTALLGKLGEDSDGEFYKSEYASIGGDVSKFCSTAQLHNGRCLSLVTPDSERTMRTDLGAAADISPADITPECFEGISHVHIEGYLIFNEPVFRKLLEEARKAGCTVSLDLASFEVVNATKSIISDVLDFVDILFANEDEAKAFCGHGDPEKALEELNNYCNTVVVKLGKQGSLLKSGNDKAVVKADIVEAIDTTGAGDLWQAGFLYGYLQGKSLEDSGKYGSVLGAEVVQIMGASIPEERWESIRKKLK